VFKAVMLGAGLAQVGDAGVASVGPGQEVVCFIVEGVVVAAWEVAPAVAEPEPLTLGLRDTVAGPSDFQGRAVTGICEDAVEGIGAVGNQTAGHGRRDRPVPVQDGWFIGDAQ